MKKVRPGVRLVVREINIKRLSGQARSRLELLGGFWRTIRPFLSLTDILTDFFKSRFFGVKRKRLE